MCKNRGEKESYQIEIKKIYFSGYLPCYGHMFRVFTPCVTQGFLYLSELFGQKNF